MIYYWPGADVNFPSGGIRTHYRHVELLNAMGIPASILHCTPPFKPSWFESPAPVAWINADDQEFSVKDDIIVVNEILGPDTGANAPGVRKMIFNQNCHYTFRGYEIPPAPDCPTPYRNSPEILGTMVLSPYCAAALKMAFPEHPIHLVPHGFDADRYPLGENKKKQIAYMPRKHEAEAQMVFGYLRYMGALDGWDVVAIDGRTEKETLSILRDSLLFFAFGYPEGGTLPPFEAMASGCVVIGYGGFSSDKWVAKCGGVLVPSADTVSFVYHANRLLRWPVDKLTAWGVDARTQTLIELAGYKEREALEKLWRPLA